MMIQEHQTLEMHNVLSYRAKMTQPEIAAKMQEVGVILNHSGAQQSGPVVTTTFSMEPGPSGPVLDFELLVPLDHEIQAPTGFTWKPRFLLTNALMAEHVGNPAGLEEAADELNAYMVSHHLTPISTGYNVTVRDAMTPEELDQVVIHIYVGISPNIL